MIYTEVFSESKTRLFADDTSLILFHKNQKELKTIAVNQIERLVRWCNSNKLTINFEKTYYILFRSKNKSIKPDLNEININGKAIKRVSSIKYLGVYIDELLTWREHVLFIHKSLVKYYGIFNHVKRFLNKKIIRKIYFAFVYSRIQYGIEIWGGCGKDLLHRIQVIQSGLLKMLLTKNRMYSTNQLHLEMRLLKVKDIYRMQLLLFMTKCLHGKSTQIFNSFFSVALRPYHLRNQGYETDYARTNVGYFSIKNNCIREWNNIPHQLKDKSMQLNFKKHIATHYLTYYRTND